MSKEQYLENLGNPEKSLLDGKVKVRKIELANPDDPHGPTYELWKVFNSSKVELY